MLTDFLHRLADEASISAVIRAVVVEENLMIGQVLRDTLGWCSSLRVSFHAAAAGKSLPQFPDQSNRVGAIRLAGPPAIKWPAQP